MITRRTAITTLAQTLLLGAAATTAQAKSAYQTSGDDLQPRFAPGSVILFQGDSITEGGRGYGADPNHVFGQDYAYLIAAPCGAHYPDKDWTFYNRGISGNKVTDLAARWQKDALDLKPDILSVLIGVNDAGSVINSGGTGGVTADQYEQVYDQILGEAAAANPALKIVLGQPFVEPGRATNGSLALWHTEIQKRQAAVDRLAAKYHAPVVPLQGVLDTAIKNSTQPSTYWVWDGIHPTYAGHQLVAEEWLRTVNRFYYKSSTTAS